MNLGMPSLTFSPTFSDAFKYSPQTTLPRSTFSQPTRKNDMGVNAGGALEGAGSGASIGSTAGPYGAIIGGVIGGVAGLFKPKPKSGEAPAGSITSGLGAPSMGSSGMPSLLGALGTGLGSLGFSNTQTNTQIQSVSNDTSVNVTNVLGGQPFGGANLTTGEFDVFKTISDVFAIRDAQAAATTFSGGVVSAASGVTTKEGNKIMPLVLLAGGGVLLLYFLTGKGK